LPDGTFTHRKSATFHSAHPKQTFRISAKLLGVTMRLIAELRPPPDAALA
jgi:hypothetical protein